MEYFELKDEDHHQIAHKKTGLNNINIVKIGGIPLAIWRSKVFEKC